MRNSDRLRTQIPNDLITRIEKEGERGRETRLIHRTNKMDIARARIRSPQQTTQAGTVGLRRHDREGLTLIERGGIGEVDGGWESFRYWRERWTPSSHRSSRRSLAYPLPRFVHRLMDNTHLSTTWEEEEDLGIKGGRQDHSVIRIRGCVKPY